MIRFVLLTALGVLLNGSVQTPTTQWQSISPDGRTQILWSGRPGPRVVVGMETVRISRSDALFPVGDSFNGLTEAVFVKTVTITHNEDSVFVWRSAFADLVNPTRAVLLREGSNFLLRIGCRDGAEAFTVEITFDGTAITRRRVFGTLSTQPSEDTQYRLREMPR